MYNILELLLKICVLQILATIERISMKKFLLLLVVISSLMLACRGTATTKTIAKPASPVATPIEIGEASLGSGSIQKLLAEAKKIVMAKAEVTIAADEINTKQVEEQQWADRSLGCPQPNTMYAQVVTDGYVMVLEAQESVYEFHTDTKDFVVLCMIDGKRLIEEKSTPVPTSGKMTDFPNTVIVYQRQTHESDDWQQWTIYKTGQIEKADGSILSIEPDEITWLFEFVEKPAFREMEIPSVTECDGCLVQTLTVHDSDESHEVIVIEQTNGSPDKYPEVLMKNLSELWNLLEEPEK